MSEQPNSPEEPIVPEAAYAASEGLVVPGEVPASRGESVTPEPQPQAPEARDLERKRKRRDLWIGFGGWWIVAILARSVPGVVLYYLWLIGNIVALIILAFKRPRIALGMLAAIVSAFILVFVGLMVIYFVSVQGGNIWW